MPIFLFLSSYVAALVLLKYLSHTPLYSLLGDFWNTSFIPDKNTAVLESASGINFLYLYYLSFLIVITIGVVLTLMRIKPFIGWGRFVRYLQTQTLIVLTILIIAQTISHTRYFLSDLDKFFNKSMQQKLSYNFAKSYAFAQYCKMHLPGKHYCGIRTDIDIQPQMNLITYLAVRYYVYPLDVLTPGDETEKDCMIVFLKENPGDNIPAQFSVKPAFDTRSLIAIRKGLLP